MEFIRKGNACRSGADNEGGSQGEFGVGQESCFVVIQQGRVSSSLGVSGWIRRLQHFQKYVFEGRFCIYSKYLFRIFMLLTYSSPITNLNTQVSFLCRMKQREPPALETNCSQQISGLCVRPMCMCKVHGLSAWRKRFHSINYMVVLSVECHLLIV